MAGGINLMIHWLEDRRFDPNPCFKHLVNCCVITFFIYLYLFIIVLLYIIIYYLIYFIFLWSTFNFVKKCAIEIKFISIIIIIIIWSVQYLDIERIKLLCLREPYSSDIATRRPLPALTKKTCCDLLVWRTSGKNRRHFKIKVCEHKCLSTWRLHNIT